MLVGRIGVGAEGIKQRHNTTGHSEVVWSKKKNNNEQHKRTLTLVPINDRQYTATSNVPAFKGTCFISQAVTRSLTATRSNECTLFLESLADNFASPQPKSPITSDGWLLSWFTITSNGFLGHALTCCR